MSSKETEAVSKGFQLSEEERQELENLMFDIKRSLHEAEYGIILDHAVLPNGNIEVIVKLGALKVDEKTKEEVQQIATDVLKHNGYDISLFQFNVTSFYHSENGGNQFSQRLSYNDLMGDVMLTLNEMGYAVAVHGKVTSDKNVVISLGLPHNQFDEESKKAVQQLATEVIKRYKFEPEIFQFNITSYYNS